MRSYTPDEINEIKKKIRTRHANTMEDMFALSNPSRNYPGKFSSKERMGLQKFLQKEIAEETAQGRVINRKPWILGTQGEQNYNRLSTSYKWDRATDSMILRESILPSAVEASDPLKTMMDKYIYSNQGKLDNSGGLNRWRGNFASRRADFYNKIHPSSFDRQLMQSRGFEYGKYLGKRQLAEISSVDPAGMLKAMTGKDKATIGLRAFSNEGYESVQGRGKGQSTSIKLRVGSQGKFARAMAYGDKSFKSSVTGEGVISYTRQPISSVDARIYLGKPTQNAQKMYMTRSNALRWGSETFGQTKYIKDIKTGRVMPLGKKITGVMPSEFIGKNALEAMEDLRGLTDIGSKNTMLRKARSMMLEMEQGASIFNDIIEDGVQMAGRGKGNTLDRYMSGMLREQLGRIDKSLLAEDVYTNFSQKKMRMLADKIDDFENNIRTMSDIMYTKVANQGFEGKSYRGFNKVRDLVEGMDGRAGLEPGRLVQMGDKIGRIEQLSDVGQITYRTPKGKLGSLGRLLDGTQPDMFGAEAGDLFKVRFNRKPTVGNYYATEILSESGDVLGNLHDDMAKTFSRGTATGLLDESRYARVYYDSGIYDKATKKYSKPPSYVLRMFKDKRDAFLRETPKGYSSDFGTVQTNKLSYLDDIGKGLDDSMLATETDDLLNQLHLTNIANKGPKPALSESLLAKKFPKLLQIHGDEAAGNIDDILRGASKFKKGLLIGAAVTVGAMMLLKAKQEHERKPLTPDDGIQEQGESRTSEMVGSVTTPYQRTARVIQNNTGYTTNVSMSALDRSGRDDYSKLAGSMGSMSRSVTGNQRAMVNMQIMDDSDKMNRYAMDRKIKSYIK